MTQMLNEFIDLSYNTKNEQAIQRCRWKKRIQQDTSQLKGSDRTLMKLYEYTLSLYDDVKYFTNYDREKTLSIYGIDMPYKTGKLKGQLTTPEIRKLIRAHNKLSKITIPTGSTREQILNLVKKNGYEVNHKKQQLTRRMGQPSTKTITMKQAQDVLKPKTKTALQQQKAQERKQAKEQEQKKKERDIKKQTIQQQKQVSKKVEEQKKKKAIQQQVGKQLQKQQKKVSKEASMLDKLEDTLKSLAEDLVKTNNKGYTKQQIEQKEKLLKSTYTQLSKLYPNVSKLPPKVLRYSERIYNRIHGNPPDPTKNDGLNINMIKQPEFKQFKTVLSDRSKTKHANDLKKFKRLSTVKKEEPKKKSVMKTVKPEDSKLLQRKGVGSVPPPTIKSAGATKKITPKPKPAPKPQPIKPIPTAISGSKGEVKIPNPMSAVKPKAPKLLSIKSKQQYQGTINKLERSIGTFDTQSQNKAYQRIFDSITSSSAINIINEFLNGDDTEEEDEEDPEVITSMGDRRLTELKGILQKMTRDIVKKFKSQKPAPTKKEIKQASISLSRMARSYEEKRNIEFEGSAGEKLEDLIDLYQTDIRGYKN